MGSMQQKSMTLKRVIQLLFSEKSSIFGETYIRYIHQCRNAPFHCKFMSSKYFFSTLCIISILFHDRTSLNSTFESLLINITHIFRFMYYVCVYKIWHLQANQGSWHKDFNSLWGKFLINISYMIPTMDMNSIHAPNFHLDNFSNKLTFKMAC